MTSGWPDLRKLELPIHSHHLNRGNITQLAPFLVHFRWLCHNNLAMSAQTVTQPETANDWKSRLESKMSVAAICISAKCSPAQTSFQAYHIWTLMMCPAARHQWWGIANCVTIPRVHVSMFGHHWSLMDSDSEYVKSPATARASPEHSYESQNQAENISADKDCSVKNCVDMTQKATHLGYW